MFALSQANAWPQLGRVARRALIRPRRKLKAIAFLIGCWRSEKPIRADSPADIGQTAEDASCMKLTVDRCKKIAQAP